MPQYPIPQFIEEEGKIIFFMTFRQFFMLVGGGVGCVIFYFLFPFALFVIASILLMGIIFVVAFVKVHNASIITVFMHFLGFTTSTKNYIWKKQNRPYPMKVEKAGPQKQSIETFGKKPEEVHIAKIQNSKLKEIKKLVETKK